MVLFKLGGLKIIRQTAKLKSPPNKLRMRYNAYAYLCMQQN